MRAIIARRTLRAALACLCVAALALTQVGCKDPQRTYSLRLDHNPVLADMSWPLEVVVDPPVTNQSQAVSVQFEYDHSVLDIQDDGPLFYEMVALTPGQTTVTATVTVSHVDATGKHTPLYQGVASTVVIVEDFAVEDAFLSVGALKQMLLRVPTMYVGDQSGTWESDDTAVAAVDPSGLVAGVSEGTALITYRHALSTREAKAFVTVTTAQAASAAGDAPVFLTSSHGYQFNMVAGTANYIIEMRASGQQPIAYTFSPTAVPPPDAELNMLTGDITIPKSAPTGVYSFLVQASNAAGKATQEVKLAVSNAAIPAAFAAHQTNYRFQKGVEEGQTKQKVTVTGSTPMAFSLAPAPGGALPAGLSIDAGTGELTFAASLQAGEYPFVMCAANAAGVTQQVATLAVYKYTPKLMDSQTGYQYAAPFGAGFQAVEKAELAYPLIMQAALTKPDGTAFDGSASVDYASSAQASGTSVGLVFGEDLPVGKHDFLLTVSLVSTPTYKDTRPGSITITASKAPLFQKQPHGYVFTLTQPVVDWKQSLKATGDELSYQLAAASGQTLSPFISVNEKNGELTVRKGITPGTYNFILRAKNKEGTVSQAIRVVVTAAMKPVIAQENHGYAFHVSASGTDQQVSVKASGAPPIRFSVAAAGGGALDPAITINETTGLLVLGHTAAPGTHSFIITARNDYGTDTKACTLSVASEGTKPKLMDEAHGYIFMREQGQADMKVQVRATGTLPVNIVAIALDGGPVRPGISVDMATGILTIGDLPAGQHRFLLKADNDFGFDTRECVVNVAPSAAEPPRLTASANGFDFTYQQDSAALSAVIPCTGTAPITFSLASVTGAPVPQGVSLASQTGQLSVVGLQHGTYSFMLTATNAYGTDTRPLIITVVARR